MKRFVKGTKLLTDLKSLRALLTFRHNGYLSENGWFESVKKQSSVDRAGEPLPWTTYPSIKFLQERLPQKARLFEFGAGNSTLYYAKHVGLVRAVEHSRDWFESIRLQLPENASIQHIELSANGPYSRAAAESKTLYDIIVVDGRDRVNCIKNSLPCLKKDGVIIVDDSERQEYREGLLFLQRKEFGRIDFWGIAPGMWDEKCTSIFYRPKNCLKI